MQQQQHDAPILAFLGPLVVCIRENTPGGDEDGVPTMICVNTTNLSSCDAFAAELIRAVRQAEPMNQPHVLWHLGETLHEFVMTVAAQKVRRIHFGGCLVAWPKTDPPPPVPLTKLELETLSMSILRARRALVHQRRLHGTPMYKIGMFLLARVHRMRVHKKIGKTMEERRATRAAARFPGVRQLLRRKDDGNDIAGVFKRQDVASVVADYLGYVAW